MVQSRRLFVDVDRVPRIADPGEAPAAPQQPTGPLLLDDEEGHYARDVLRLGDGAQVDVLDGHGYHAPATLQLEGRRGPVYVALGGAWAYAAQLQGGPKLTMLVALPKGERADWMVEKLAELGCYSIVLLHCDRSVGAERGHKGGGRLARLGRVTRAAARQARHGRLPLLSTTGLVPYAEALKDAAEHAQHLWLADLAPQLPPFFAAVGAHPGRRHAIVVGPEGGLAPDELNLAAKAGYTPVGLGPHVLRVETAAVAAAVAASQVRQ